jgi:predicted Ser/Thr protein kinase
MDNNHPFCPRCGGPLPAGAADATACPACLLSGAAGSDAETAGPPNRFQPPAPEALAPLLPALEITRLIGQGGMGAVYEARQRSLDRRVALKVLPVEVAARPEFSERFERESRTLAGLDHPGLVTVHDSGRAGDFYYFIMEYVDGTNLRELVTAGRLAPREALGIVPQICDALQYAHDHGVVHRDIKPENILIDRRGRVKITDFGLVKLLARSPRDVSLTATRFAVGTPAYMAPEQLEHPDRVDHRADIYSLGVVFYELLTGELPLGRFDAPSERVQVDVRLDEIVLRTLAKEPARRYQHASEVGTDVRHVSQGRPSTTDEARADVAPATVTLSDERPVVRGAFAVLAIAGYAACGLALGLLWNLGPFGLAVGTLLTGALTFWVGSLGRRYVESLQEGWRRSSRHRRVACVVMSLLFLAVSVASWATAAVWHLDDERLKPLEQRPQTVRDPLYWPQMAQESGLGADRAEGEPRLGGARLSRPEASLPFLLLVIAPGLIVQFGASLLVLDTGRFRGTWRWSIPLAASMVLFQLFAPIATFATLWLPFTTSSYSAPIQSVFTVDDDYEQVASRLDTWLETNGYGIHESAYGHVNRSAEGGDRQGSFRRAVVYPAPATRRWKWRWGKAALDRPLFSIELYGESDGSGTAVRVRTANIQKGVDDRELWLFVLEILEEELEKGTLS